MRFESIMKGLLTLLVVTFLLASTPVVLGQRDEAHIRVIVNMVQLNVAVTDNKGNYISGLRPDDFAVVGARRSGRRQPWSCGTFTGTSGLSA